MPRDYGKVSHRFWTGDTGRKIRALGLEARVVATYLVTCGSSNMIGLYYLPLTLLSHETGIPFEGALKALRSLSEAHFSYYDEADEVVFVPRMAEQQIAESLSATDKQQHGVVALLKEYKKSRFVADFVAIYGESYHLPDGLISEAPSKPHRSPIEAPSKPGAGSGEQEQRAGEQAPSKVSLPDGTIAAQKPPAKIRPDTSHHLEHCLRVAVERDQPQAGRWIPGRFSDRDADKLLRDLGDIQAALPELERKIALFAKDPDMQPWSVAKFVDKYNAIGLPKLQFGKAPVSSQYAKV